MDELQKLNTVFSRFIVIFGGEYGRCKSLSETALVFLELLHTQKTKVITNMPIKYPVFSNLEITPLVETKQFDLNELSKMKNSIMVWDEMHNDLFSRNFNTEKNKFIPNISVGFRKDNIKLRGSLQFFDTLEKMMGLMMEMVIIPSFVTKYSSDSEEDRKIRISNKDFTVSWECTDKKNNNERFYIKINLYPFLKMYNTNFKPYTLAVNHSEYMERLYKNKKTYSEEYVNICSEKINENETNWRGGLEEIP